MKSKRTLLKPEPGSDHSRGFPGFFAKIGGKDREQCAASSSRAEALKILASPVPGRLAVLIALGALLVWVAGCQNKPDPRNGRVLGMSKQVAPYPPAQNIPLDPALRAAALNQLDADLRAVDPEVRAHALEALQKSHAPGLAEAATAALDDSAPLVRYEGCLAVGDIQLKSAHPALLRLAHDPDAAVRVVARYALHRIGDYRYSHDFEKLWRDPEARVRGTTAMVLGMLQDPSAVKILQAMRLDSSPAVRQQASAALWELGDHRGLKDLIGWSLSRFPDDKMMAIIGLAEPRNREVIQDVRNALVSDYAEVNLTAARAMGQLGSDEGYGIARRGARSVDPRERIEAALALGAIGRSDAQDVLKNLLHDSDPNVRVAAAEAILELK